MDGNSHIHARMKKLHIGAFVIGCLTMLLATSCSTLCEKPSENGKGPVKPTATEAVAPQSTPSPSGETVVPPKVTAAPSASMSTEPSEKTITPESKSVSPKTVPAAKETVSPPAETQTETHKETPRTEKPSSPPLDLQSLEKRLKETKAIGIFTKLALKNQVDDLLERFRAYYQGNAKITLAQLRKPYEMLIMKVLALLQDNDPKLAQDLLASREAIWNVLSDREKFTDI